MKSLDSGSGQTKHLVCSGSKLFDILVLFLKKPLKNLILKKKSADNITACKLPSMQSYNSALFVSFSGFSFDDWIKENDFKKPLPDYAIVALNEVLDIAEYLSNIQCIQGVAPFSVQNGFQNGR